MTVGAVLYLVLARHCKEKILSEYMHWALHSLILPNTPSSAINKHCYIIAFFPGCVCFVLPCLFFLTLTKVFQLFEHLFAVVRFSCPTFYFLVVWTLLLVIQTRSSSPRLSCARPRVCQASHHSGRYLTAISAAFTAGNTSCRMVSTCAGTQDNYMISRVLI